MLSFRLLVLITFSLLVAAWLVVYAHPTHGTSLIARSFNAGEEPRLLRRVEKPKTRTVEEIKARQRETSRRSYQRRKAEHPEGLRRLRTERSKASRAKRQRADPAGYKERVRMINRRRYRRANEEQRKKQELDNEQEPISKTEKRQKHRANRKRYYDRNITDPAFKAKLLQQARARYHRRKELLEPRKPGRQEKGHDKGEKEHRPKEEQRPNQAAIDAFFVEPWTPKPLSQHRASNRSPSPEQPKEGKKQSGTREPSPKRQKTSSPEISQPSPQKGKGSPNQATIDALFLHDEENV